MAESTRKRPLGHVYFIQCGEDGPIKIGWAEIPGQRLRDLQVANPHPLSIRLLIRTGNRNAEGVMHRLFYSLWIRGEWFQPHPELLDWISKMIDGAHRLIDVDGVKIPLVVETELAIRDPDPFTWLSLIDMDRPGNFGLAIASGITGKNLVPEIRQRVASEMVNKILSR